MDKKEEKLQKAIKKIESLLPLHKVYTAKFDFDYFWRIEIRFFDEPENINRFFVSRVGVESDGTIRREAGFPVNSPLPSDFVEVIVNHVRLGRNPVFYNLTDKEMGERELDTSLRV